VWKKTLKADEVQKKLLIEGKAFTMQTLKAQIPFVRTDKPNHSGRDENFICNQNSPARSVKF